MSYICRILRKNYCQTFSNAVIISFKKNITRLQFRIETSTVTHKRFCSSEILSPPTATNEEKNYPEKLVNITEEISKLTLIEVSELNNLLKKTLNIKDTPMMVAGVGALPVASPAADDEDEIATKEVKASFSVKLTKFESEKKIALIKEVKNLVEGMNLVQAKKFVESVPQIVKADVSKDEAENLQKLLENVGGQCEIL